MLVKIDKNGANIVPDGFAKVRIAFELDQYGMGLEAVYECLTCSDLLGFVEAKRKWICPSCLFELHPMEADLVVMHAKALLDCLQAKSKTEVQRKTQWAWVAWLRRLLRLKEA